MNNGTFVGTAEIDLLGPGTYSVVAEDSVTCSSDSSSVTLVDPSGRAQYIYYCFY